LNFSLFDIYIFLLEKKYLVKIYEFKFLLDIFKFS